MHPGLKLIAAALDRHAQDSGLRWRFACACVQEVVDQLEDERAIQACKLLLRLLPPADEADPLR